MTKETLKAYAAGIIDGEGCVAIRAKTNPAKTRVYHNLVVKVGMTGKCDTLELLRINWGGKICRGGYLNRQMQWSLYCNQAELFLRDILPYLVIKKDQVETALAFQENRRLATEEYGESFVDILKKLKQQSYA